MSATEQHPDQTHQFWGPEVEVIVAFNRKRFYPKRLLSRQIFRTFCILVSLLSGSVPPLRVCRRRDIGRRAGAVSERRTISERVRSSERQ